MATRRNRSMGGWRTTNRPMVNVAYAITTLAAALAKVFVNNTIKGLWWSPPVLARQYQASDGAVLVTTPGSNVVDPPVGLILDSRLGEPVLGADIVVNGAFVAGTSWTFTTAGSNFTGDKANFAGVAAQILTSAGTYAFGTNKVWQITYTISNYVGGSVSAQFLTNGTTPAISGVSRASNGTHTERIISNGNNQFRFVGSAGAQTYSIDDLIIQEVPGNHASQATAAARPKLSSKNNELTSTVHADASFTKEGITLNGLRKLVVSAVSSFHTLKPTIVSITGPWTVSFKAKANGYNRVIFSPNVATSCVGFNLDTGVKEGASRGASSSTTITPIADGAYSITITGNSTATGTLLWFMPYNSDASLVVEIPTWIGDGISGIDIWDEQIVVGDTAGITQNVTNPNSYDNDPVKFPIFHRLDGADDGLGSGALVAGAVLSNAMDFLIAVKRTSNVKGLFGFQTALGTAYFGAFDSAGAAAVSNSGAGAATIHVNNAAIAGGASATRVSLDAAMPINQWVIVEFRNLDLSTWTAFNFGNYTGGFNFTGLVGDMVLLPSGASNLNEIRTRLGATVGITL